LIRYRRRSEKLVYRLAEANLPTRFGPCRIIGYGVRYEEQEPLAIVWGEPASDLDGVIQRLIMNHEVL
jgi:3,4-dihydroxy 2-butanone 4-phosphate synthase/GTP cyclohydrolase II